MEERLVHGDEKALYIVCIVLSIITYVSLIISLFGIFYIIGALVVSAFLHGISVGNIRSNGVKLTERQFPEIYARARSIAMEMGMKTLPDMYIIQEGGLLNAFATNFLGRNFIVLFADLAEIAKDGMAEELDFIIAHELSHIKRRHVTKQFIILPALYIPFLANAYTRACEYTCDRMASVYINNPVAAVNALAVLAAGKKLSADMDLDEYIETAKAETGFFVGLSQWLSTHPPLPKRIEEVHYFHTVLLNQNSYQAG